MSPGCEPLWLEDNGETLSHTITKHSRSLVPLSSGHNTNKRFLNMCSCISQIGIHAFFNNVLLYQNIENVSDFVLCYVILCSECNGLEVAEVKWETSSWIFEWFGHFLSPQWKVTHSLGHINFCCADSVTDFDKVNSILKDASYQYSETVISATDLR